MKGGLLFNHYANCHLHNIIDRLKKQDQDPLHRYEYQDLTKNLYLADKNFTHAVAILALQNMEKPWVCLQNAANHLQSGGHLFLVLNHPVLRIPRQTSCEVDEKNKLQYRRINRYLSPLKIAINMHPGKDNGPVTWSFHYPLSQYFSFLKQSGFVVEDLQEWTSDKTSQGSKAKQENFSRQEFPLFMVIVAKKK